LHLTDLKEVADDLGFPKDDSIISDFLAQLPAKQKNCASFTEIACLIFGKQFRDMSDFKDPEAEAKTQAAATKAAAITNQIAEAKQREEQEKEESRILEEKIQSGLQKVIFVNFKMKFKRYSIDWSRRKSCSFRKKSERC
jgi:hypothetical protein